MALIDAVANSIRIPLWRLFGGASDTVTTDITVYGRPIIFCLYSQNLQIPSTKLIFHISQPRFQSWPQMKLLNWLLNIEGKGFKR